MKLNVPLAALRVFEAAARHQSFQLAGAELHVSGSAVSQQIATLEHVLKAQLFRRSNRRVELTDAGSSLAQALSSTFLEIDTALLAVAPHLAVNSLRVAVYQTVASRWLIPRLSELAASSPSMSVELQTGMDDIDFAKSNLDFAIRVGHGEWKDVRSYKLFEEVLLPVCAPRLRRNLIVVEDLETVSLIDSVNRPLDWEVWLRAACSANIKGRSKLRLANSSLTYEAAVAGAGVAIAQVAFVEGDLQNGALVAPYQKPVPTGRAYYLLEPKGRPNRPALKSFREWILDQARV